MWKGWVDDKILDTDIVIVDKPNGDPEEYNEGTRFKELFKCSESVYYFIHNYVKILDDRIRVYVPFHLYPAHINVLSEWHQGVFLVFHTLPTA